PDLEAAVAAPPGAETRGDAGRADLVEAVLARLDRLLRPGPRPLINATGVLLHTNLGRAPVSRAAAEAMARAASGYSDLEYALDSGSRGSRHDLLLPLIRQLTGAEAALVVNNNAGATLLMLSALALGRGVVVSRGELVEIGGGYRIPEVMAAGGARLVEVGTTNRTRIADYAAAIDETTALLLRVHTSNYRIVGFTEAPRLEDLVALAAERGLPLVDDLGSGSLLDTARFGLASEPMVPHSIAAGAALVSFSGDKLLGGPQAGIIVGRADLVARLRKHPLTRAMRPDKASLAGLHATLLHYARGEAEREVPLWRMLAADPADLAERAAGWRAALAERGIRARVEPGRSTVGGGSLPGETLPTRLLALDSAHPDALAARLRAAEMPLIGRIAEGALLLDPRTVLPDEDAALLESLSWALSGADGSGARGSA
ncbi:MAG: L-seryl-tRNA(Sec) selenium transferase, partial [Chloroflexi bacterium]|nr:L-seryl-tRNA(Sec) selenium transferase [Chloroflexota bacterium]